MIDVNKSLPNHYDEVWVRFPHGGWNKAYLDNNGKWQYNWVVTHWSTVKPVPTIDWIMKNLDIIEQKIMCKDLGFDF